MLHSSVILAVPLWTRIYLHIILLSQYNVPAMSEGSTTPGSDSLGLETLRYRISQRNSTRWGRLVYSSLSMIVRFEEA